MIQLGYTPLVGAFNNDHSGVISLIKSEQQRMTFFTVINNYIQYDPYRSIIYYICYPPTNISFPEPLIGWNDSYKVVEKYYFEDVFFYLHMYVASKVNTRECSKNRECFANNCNRTSRLMALLRRELREYISLDVSKLLRSK
jgi:hypothetical protein